MTPQEFIENAPLYTRVAIKSFSSPQSITRICSSPGCKKATTWQRSDLEDHTLQVANPEIRFDAVSYTCVLCGANSLGVIYQKLEWQNVGATWHYAAVRKIGQIPAADTQIASGLAERLGNSAGHYKKALICREQNYGIAAMAYLRRVVDEKTDELIDVMVELARTYDIDEKIAAQLIATKNEVRYDAKLEVASQLVPQALRPGGSNPLGQLYKHASIGLHDKSDEECIVIFDDVKADFEYVFSNLHLQAEERRAFAERVTRRAGKNSTN